MSTLSNTAPERAAGESLPTTSRICVTPTRNESWIIQPFLAAATSWADHVIVADQGSSDGTPEIARATPHVTLVLNEQERFDEVHRQQLLLASARRVEGPRILLALDADEALSANNTASHEWDLIKKAAPGTILRFRWVNVLPGFERAWIPPEPRAFGLIDDGAPHSGYRIHNQRLPWRADAPTLDLEDIVVVHFQYVLWDRMLSKQRWYQAWEHANHSVKSPLEIFRQYNHMHAGWPESEVRPMRDEWLKGFESVGADFKNLRTEPVTWWDRDVLDMLVRHGPEHFRRIPIWDKDWNTLARHVGLACRDLSDPRNSFERIAHRVLAATQSRRASLAVRGFERLLRSTGW